MQLIEKEIGKICCAFMGASNHEWIFYSMDFLNLFISVNLWIECFFNVAYSWGKLMLCNGLMGSWV